MGWGSGSEILRRVWNEIRLAHHINERPLVLAKLINIFWDHDCDTFDDLADEDWPELEPALKVAGWINED